MFKITFRRNKGKTKNQQVFEYLRKMGFDTINIRKAFPRLMGVTHTDMAGILGKTRPVITNTINGRFAYPDDRKVIADYFDIPMEILFPVNFETPTQTLKGETHGSSNEICLPATGDQGSQG